MEYTQNHHLVRLAHARVNFGNLIFGEMIARTISLRGDVEQQLACCILARFGQAADGFNALF